MKMGGIRGRVIFVLIFFNPNKKKNFGRIFLFHFDFVNTRSKIHFRTFKVKKKFAKIYFLVEKKMFFKLKNSYILS